MTRITDRELELAREVEWLREALVTIKNRLELTSHPINEHAACVLAGFARQVLANKDASPDLPPDQLAAWREEYRERAVIRVLLDECERAGDEVALRKGQIDELREQLDFSQQKLAKALAALKTMPHDKDRRYSECRRCQIFKELRGA